MEIGTKIKNARLEAKLSQEQVAEALGVSRQTISNWENQKTYPDIVSVVKMSDLYHISLDRLLKEEESMSNYLNYLEESTSVVKSRTKLAKLILVMSYLMIWAISLIVFWFFTGGSDAMGFGVMFLWVLLPVTTFIVSLLIGKNNYWERWKWLAAVFLGVLYMLAEYATFTTANMITFQRFALPEYGLMIAGGVISLAGMGIGCIVRGLKEKSLKKADFLKK